MSETSKHREHVLPYLRGNGVDVGCGNDPVKPDCVAIDIPEANYECYNGKGGSKANFRAFAEDLPFKDHTLDWVYSSHLLEDFPFTEWPSLLREWTRVLKPGGMLVILVPEATLWAKAVAAGQPPNDAHQHEPELGELSALAPRVGLLPVREEIVGTYSILFVAKKS
jgi:predicted SAM-dependent methyltransferase